MFSETAVLKLPLLFGPVLFDQGFEKLEVNADKTIHFLSLIPLYREEMNFKLRRGFEPLLDRLGAAGVTELLNIDRKNVCRKRWGLF